MVSRWLAMGLFLAVASGCSSLSSVLQLGNRDAVAVSAASLDPSLRYLRVTVGGRVALMVLGYIDHHPLGLIETWYSAKGEVIKLQQGRIVGTAGLSTDWREVRFDSLPRWRDVSVSPLSYHRERDEMPGYRMGIRDRVTSRSISTPKSALVVGIKLEDLAWFEEQVSSQTGTETRVDRFALQANKGGEIVVYAEQCLSHELCIAWQRWSVATSPH